MARDEFDRRMAAADARVAHALNELPAELTRDFAVSLAVATRDAYGDD